METLKVIKIGGNIIDNAIALESFLEEFSKIKGPKILVHGGGTLATQFTNEIGVGVKIVNGRRITDAFTLDIITMIYAGKINKTIVAQLQAFKCNSMGFSGADGNTVVSKKRPVGKIDFGYVGDVIKVNIRVIQLLLEEGIIPVFCAISHDVNGQLLNTNADTMASEIAIGFSKQYNVELYYCFEKNGVLQNVNDDTSVIEYIDTETYVSLINTGTIAEGMLPKLENCFHAIKHSVEKVCIGQPEMLFNSESKFTTIQA